MPALDAIARKYRRNTDITLAYLYQLTFPDDMVYIGCTTQDPFKRLYEHKHNVSVSRIGPVKYSALSYTINKYNEVMIKILAVGELKYMRYIEEAAIGILDATDRGLGYNKQFVHTVLRKRRQKRLDAGPI